MSGLYEWKNAINETSLMRKIVRLKYRDGESIVEHVSTFMGYVIQIVATKLFLKDAIQAILPLCRLPDKWENLVVTLNTTFEEENLSLQMVQTSIFSEETRRKDKGVLSQSESNLTQHTCRGRNRQRSPQRTEKS